MEFSVLDKQTVQCVMTEEEIADYGMDRRAIYQNDERAVDFFKQIMQRAEQETGFVKSGKQIAVHAVFLSDESLEITFSAGAEQNNEQAEQIAKEMETAVFKTENVMHLLAFCRNAPKGLVASAYVHEGVYFLLADVREYGVRETAMLFYAADEFMDGVCYTKSIAAFIREHGECVADGDAVEVLGGIF